MKHILPTETVNKILQYLSGKAYSEVHQLITEIKSLAEPFDAQVPVCQKPIDPLPSAIPPKGN